MSEKNEFFFLHRVATLLLDEYGGRLDSITVVLPGKRAGLYLKKHLAEISGKSLWAPQLCTISQFTESLAGKKTANSIELIFGLYSCLQKQLGHHCETFENFLKWGFTALADFNEADQHLTDTKQLFSDLRRVKEIEEWSLSGDDLSNQQTAFIHFWNQLGSLCENFRQWQKESEVFSSGLIARLASENVLDRVKTFDNHSIVFAGLHGISAAEEKIISILLKEKKAETCWDAEAFYVDNKIHEAGFFIRKYLERFGELNWISDQISQQKKHLTVHRASTAIGICAASSQLLAANDLVWNKTVVVLADENLMEPLLRSLPQTDELVNVTLGFPLSQSALYGFIHQWLQILVQVESKQALHIHHVQFEQLLSHPAMKQFTSTHSAQLRKYLVAKNYARITAPVLKELTQDFPSLSFLFGLLFPPEVAPVRFIKNLYHLLSEILESSRDEIMNTHALHIRALLQRLEGMLLLFNGTLTLAALKLLLDRIASREVIPLEGEPLGGLQIMGMLETRALDFDHVIVLGASEGTLPASGKNQSFIPYDIRKIYGLPTQEHSDALYAYNFYRLLQRASTVDLFYSQHSSSFAQSEASRYIAQLEYELPIANSDSIIEKKNCATSISPGQKGGVAIPFDHYCNERLQTLLTHGISPSALTTFIRCPLDFYYQYIIGIGEREEVEEEVGIATMGSIAHHVLEEFYRHFINAFPTADDFEIQLRTLESKVDTAFNAAAITDFMSGQNFLTRKVVVEMLRKFIQREQQELQPAQQNNIQRKILAIECELSGVLAGSSNGIPYQWKIKGKADRIELCGDKVCIIDYKSGKVEAKDLKLDPANLESIFSDPKKSKLLQVMCYVLMYCRSENIPASKCEAGIFSFPRYSQGMVWLDAGEGHSLDNEVLSAFETKLFEFIQAMFSLEWFRHNPESSFCQYCGS
ncbi:MAG: PD-(D/E)XK nuclease family protein [Flavobacteriales bacterium]|nr:PD-(D/E)XK nuclease family protein [Flavobacteriales bacterium]